ncbi:MAG: glycosyltransferase family 4 protein [Chloroflexi bacterium]|nr:glycosyltransferase family 4 protein [Chloroflexota bacterium]
MNVTFVYRYLTLGGVEVVLRSRMHALPAIGIQPSVWFLADGQGRSLFADCAQRVRIGDLRSLEEHLRDTGVDVLSVIDTPDALESLAGAPHRPKVVLEVHTPYAENRTYLRSPAIRMADTIFVPSEHQRQIVLRETSRPPEVVVVPNPIGGAFEAPLEIPGPVVGAPIVAWVGRLDWLKNWGSFLRVAGRVSRLVPEAEFWVVGSGTVGEEAEFERYCRRSSAMRRLRWLRGQPHATMPRLFDEIRASGGVVVSTSRGESFGMAVAEAMARGCAVVAPRCGPFTEFIADGVEGSLYQPGREAEASEAVVSLLSDLRRRQRLGAKAREMILRSHATDVALEALALALKAVETRS